MFGIGAIAWWVKKATTNSDRYYEQGIVEKSSETSESVNYKIGAYDMQELMLDILQQLLYKKYEFLKNYKEKYIFEIKVLNSSIDKYLEAV